MKTRDDAIEDTLLEALLAVAAVEGCLQRRDETAETAT